MTNWYTSDWHLRHHMVTVTKRGFASREEHDEMLIAQMNMVVRPDDILWVAGDVGLGRSSEILPLVARVNGHKQLVTGNHDAPWPANKDARKHQAVWLEVFESVQAYARVSILGRKVLVSHFPYAGDHTAEDRHTQWRLRDEGEWLIHGHVHSKHRVHPDYPRQVHVGVDAWGGFPASDREIAKIIEGCEGSSQ